MAGMELEEEQRSLYPIAVLIDELKHDDMAKRLVAMNNLTTIARALGPDRTRTEFVPFLSESMEDEDEVLLAMAQQLGQFVECVGGSTYAHELLAPLETLCTAEESTVRDKAVEAVGVVVESMSEDALKEHFFPLVRRMATKEWFTARISSCAFFPVAYTRFPAQTQQELRRMFAVLCRDDTPMVRRAAAKALGTLAKEVVERSVICDEIVPLFLHLADDDQDSVRLLIIDNCIALGELLPPADLNAQVLPAALNAAADRSWRVRWAVCNGFQKLCSVMGPQVSNDSLATAFEKLLKDQEAEVRTVAAFQVSEVARQLSGKNVVDLLVPGVTALANDSSDHVRSSLASVVMGLAPVLGRDNSVRLLLPLFLQLLRDANSEVRLNIISKLDSLDRVIGIELLSQSLLPAIMELAEDRSWRVRLAIIEFIPQLARQLGPSFFDDRLSQLCMSWLTDKVFSIREAASANLKALAEQFGLSWTQTHVVPRVVSMYSHANYLYRMTSLHAVQVLSGAEVLSKEVLGETLLPLVLPMATDPVPNIRFNVAKTLQSMSLRLDDKLVQDQVRPCLTSLRRDVDQDVQFFAAKALAASAAETGSAAAAATAGGGAGAGN